MQRAQTSIIALAVLFAGLFLAACGRAPEPVQALPYDVVLVSLDTLRQDGLGCYGYDRPTSPGIDAFSRECVLFEEAIAQAPATKPSHASLFTSLNEIVHGALSTPEHVLAPGHLTMAEILKQCGYRTASFNAGGYVRGIWGLDQGFDLYDSSSVFHLEETVKLASDWLGQIGEDRFFLFLHTYEVHHPYQPRPRHVELLDTGYQGSLPDEISVNLLAEINSGKREISAADLEHIRSLYDAETRSMDEAFVTFIDNLKSSGRYDNTIIIVTSDHGEEFGEHGRIGWHSHTLYDELLKVPLLIKLPGSQHAGNRVSGMVRLIDVLPTLIDLLGLPALPSLEGVSLTGAIQSSRSTDLVAVSSLGEGEQFAVRNDRWKLYEIEDEPSRLFDLQADPRETTDVSAAHPDVLKKMKDWLTSYLENAEQARRQLTDPDRETLEELRQLGYIK